MSSWFLAIVLLGGVPEQAWPETEWPTLESCELAEEMVSEMWETKRKLLTPQEETEFPAVLVVTHCYQKTD